MNDTRNNNNSNLKTKNVSYRAKMNVANRLLKLRRAEFLTKLNLRSSSCIAEKKLLFTPGPLLTSKKVKQSMMVDLGSRDAEFINVIKFIQTKLLEVAGLGNSQDYVTVLMQGSGTFGVESVVQTVAKRDGSSNFLILENGAYGKRMATLCNMLNVQHHVESYPENRSIDLKRLEEFMSSGKQFTHVVSKIFIEIIF
jgi:2-aminoethylphosphonate-pyruvate transaminase